MSDRCPQCGSEKKDEVLLFCRLAILIGRLDPWHLSPAQPASDLDSSVMDGNAVYLIGEAGKVARRLERDKLAESANVFAQPANGEQEKAKEVMPNDRPESNSASISTRRDLAGDASAQTRAYEIIREAANALAARAESADGQLEQARAETAHWKAEKEKCHEAHVREVQTQMGRAESAEKSLAEAREALRKYGRHLDNCRRYVIGGVPCTCGFETALAERK